MTETENRGVFIYVREDITIRELKITILQKVLKVFLSKLIWYQYFFENIGKTDKYPKHYDKYMLAGDFNTEESEPGLSQFLYE